MCETSGGTWPCTDCDGPEQPVDERAADAAYVPNTATRHKLRMMAQQSAGYTPATKRDTIAVTAGSWLATLKPPCVAKASVWALMPFKAAAENWPVFFIVCCSATCCVCHAMAALTLRSIPNARAANATVPSIITPLLIESKDAEVSRFAAAVSSSDATMLLLASSDATAVDLIARKPLRCRP